jgi:hypothetical protein
MNSLLNPGTPPPQIPPEKSEWHPIGITLAAAVLLGAGSCAGAIAGGGSWVTEVFAFLFFVCVIVFLGGLVWAFGTWAQKFRRGG